MIPAAYNAGTLYSVLPADRSGDFDVVRATSATRVNEQGLIESVGNNVPRFDFDPVTKKFKGILVEPQATNLLLRSEEFDNAYWNKFNATVTVNDAIAPDGTTSADLLISTVSLGGIRPTPINPYPTTGIYTFSIYAKPLNIGDFLIRLERATNTANFRYNWNTNVLTVTGANAISGKVEDAGNGYLRFICTANIINTNFELEIGHIGGANFSSHIWGAQLEAGSVATSYIPTVTSTVTRNADVITRTNASALIGQTEGTLYCEIKANSDTNIQGLLIEIDSDTSLVLSRLRLGHQLTLQANEISIIRGTTPLGTPYQLINGLNKIALAYTFNTAVLFANGILISSVTISDITIAFNRISLGSRQGGSGLFLSDHIRAAALFPTRLSNAELQQLTTL